MSFIRSRLAPLAVGLAVTFTLTLTVAACGGPSAPAPTTTPTLPGEPSPKSDETKDGAEGGAVADAAPPAKVMSDEEVLAVIEGSISMTEQMAAAAKEANKDCPLMATKLEAVFTANADLMSRGDELALQPNIDARMEKALGGPLGKRAQLAHDALGVELEPCSDSEEVAKLFERLFE
jgi:hypothetical protein